MKKNILILIILLNTLSSFSFTLSGGEGKGEVIEGELKIVLYPNPAGDFIMYRTEISDNENAMLVIYNMLGEALHTEKISVHQQEGRIDLSEFVSGMYLYKVYINNAPVRAGPFVISK